MKKQFLLALLLFTSKIIFAQNCSDLFISEYVEGTNNNKSIEIYNASSTSISFANYRLIRYDNGIATILNPAQQILMLPSNIVLQPFDTYVISLNITNSTDPQNPNIDINLQVVSDTLLCPSCATASTDPRVLCFNGDDALALQKNINGTWTNIDIFACIGERPSNSVGSFSPTAGWTALAPFAQIPATYNSSTQGPYFQQYWTLNKTLIRKSSVKRGVNVNPNFLSFNPSIEWDSLPSDSFDSLGFHYCQCEVLSQNRVLNSSSVKVFPTLVSNELLIKVPFFTGSVSVYDILGKLVFEKNNFTINNSTSIHLGHLVAGHYTLKLNNAENKFDTNTKVFKFIKN
jgi:hypothetical protein